MAVNVGNCYIVECPDAEPRYRYIKFYQHQIDDFHEWCQEVLDGTRPMYVR